MMKLSRFSMMVSLALGAVACGDTGDEDRETGPGGAGGGGAGGTSGAPSDWECASATSVRHKPSGTVEDCGMYRCREGLRCVSVCESDEDCIPHPDAELEAACPEAAPGAGPRGCTYLIPK